VRLDPDHIRSRLQRQHADDVVPAAAPQAAVLVLLCTGHDHPVTMLTRRSDAVPHHAGQISFPGGRVHRDDASLEAAALREATEEIGLDPSRVAILGRLPVTLVPSSGFAITPVVAWAETRLHLQPDPREVAEMIACPLGVALDPAAYKTGTVVRDGVTREFWYIEFDGHNVWGATARILRSLALLLSDGGRSAL
jgi:8-oxo-dGTP pyrophosphatase MutT (NUDIX family)